LKRVVLGKSTVFSFFGKPVCAEISMDGEDL
jgi:hypothetical protein